MKKVDQSKDANSSMTFEQYLQKNPLFHEIVRLLFNDFKF